MASSLKLQHTPAGLLLHLNSRKIALDPTKKFKADYVFISHAHSDHLPPSVGDATVIASEETVRLARERGLKIDSHVDSMKGIELVETGHILGSRGLFVEDTFYYTGDIAGRQRGFMPAPKPVSCETLVIESTYGKPVYRFPSLASVLLSANRIISSSLDKGKSVVVEGYPLGKSQLLTYLFQSWSPLYVYGNVNLYNRIYKEFGVELPEKVEEIKSPSEVEILQKKPGLAVFPSTGVRGEVKRKMESMGIANIRFTGWALSFSSHGLSTLLPVSDHADYEELVSFVKRCKPEQVLTSHGFTYELASSLKRIGFRAKPVTERQVSLTEYLD